MAYSLTTTSAAEKDLVALPRAVLLRVDAVLVALASEPRPKGVLKLRATRGERWRVRVGDDRVLYAIDDRRKLIEIARILHRREAYRNL